MSRLPGRPLTFLLTGFAWLVLSSIAGIAILVGLVQGTPLPSLLRLAHTHAALVGGVAGLLAASFLTAITVSTTNFQSFSELAFSFTLTPRIVLQSLAFALLMGFVGGFLPAIKASRMKIVDALRAD